MKEPFIGNTITSWFKAVVLSNSANINLNIGFGLGLYQKNQTNLVWVFTMKSVLQSNRALNESKDFI